MVAHNMVSTAKYLSIITYKTYAQIWSYLIKNYKQYIKKPL